MTDDEKKQLLIALKTMNEQAKALRELCDVIGRRVDLHIKTTERRLDNLDVRLVELAEQL